MMRGVGRHRTLPSVQQRNQQFANHVRNLFGLQALPSVRALPSRTIRPVDPVHLRLIAR